MAAAVTLLLCAAAPASAQAGGLTVTLGTPTLAFNTPGVLDFDTGWVDHSGVLVSVASHGVRSWELRIRADAPTMGGYGKPVGDILWRTATSSVWTPLTGTDQVVAQGQGDVDVTVLFRLRLDWARDLPDLYSAGITFTAVRP
ncbi:MAG: hypothetical protein KY466_09985 [Gemmatimonadetes bacterium]|nr:hypothetical protein [Gemmatimonadota bacterium]